MESGETGRNSFAGEGSTSDNVSGANEPEPVRLKEKHLLALQLLDAVEERSGTLTFEPPFADLAPPEAPRVRVSLDSLTPLTTRNLIETLRNA